MIGGLGNQMFQYASSRALSLKRGVPLLLDTQDFSNYALHNGFELDRIFHINAKTASSSEIREVLGWRSPSFLRKKLFRNDLSWLRGKHLYVDTQFESWKDLAQVPDSCYLMGNWQTENYFKDYRSTILADFRFKSALQDHNRNLELEIINSNAISIHVRRGDYVSNAASLAFHGVCSTSYYQSAINHIIETVSAPTFFVFSDDMTWVRENIKLEHPCFYVDHNKGHDSFNDMHLMSLCKHNIIANSSFSWWGAWLNTNEEKTVIAPKKWFAADFDSSHIVPEKWIKL